LYVVTYSKPNFFKKVVIDFNVILSFTVKSFIDLLFEEVEGLILTVEASEAVEPLILIVEAVEDFLDFVPVIYKYTRK
jgi:hypothetical protein